MRKAAFQSEASRPNDGIFAKIPSLADAHHDLDPRLRAVHELWTAYRELGPQEAAGLLDPDVEFVTVAGHVHHGIEAVRSFFAAYPARGEEFMASPFTFELHEPDVLVVGHRRVRSGGTLDGAYLYFLHSIRDGRVCRLAAFASREEAIADVQARNLTE